MSIAKNLALQVPQLRRIHQTLQDLRVENDHLKATVDRLYGELDDVWAKHRAAPSPEELAASQQALREAQARLVEADARAYVLASDLARLESAEAALSSQAHDEALASCERLSEQLAEARAERDRIQAQSSDELKALEAQKDGLELELQVLKGQLAQELASAAAGRAALEHELQALTDQFTQELATAKAGGAALEREVSALKELEADLYQRLHDRDVREEALRRDLADLTVERDALRRERDTLEMSVVALEGQVLGLQAQLDGAAKTAARLDAQNQVLTSDVARITSSFADFQGAASKVQADQADRIAELEKERDDLLATVEGGQAVETERDALDLSLKALQAQLADLSAQLDGSAANIARLDSANQGLEALRLDAEARLERLSGEVARLERELLEEATARASDQGERAKLADRLQSVSAELDAARVQIRDLEEERNRLRDEVERLGRTISEFEDRRPSLEEASALSQRLAALTDLVVKSNDLDRLETSLGSRLSLIRYDVEALHRRPSGDASIAEPALRRRYLDLLEASLVGELSQDPNMDPWSPQDYDEDRRLIGRDWPRSAMTMIGTVRMRNIRSVLEDVLTAGVPGDVIETGVWRGGACIYMRGILAAHGVTDRTVWVADSFAGLPSPDPKKYPADRGDVHHTYDDLIVSLDEVKDNFGRYDLLDEQVNFLPGWFSETLSRAPIEQLAVLRLDGDMYASTMDALEALYLKVSPGGYVIIDDYILKPCRQAVDDFRKKMRIKDPIIEVDGAAVYWRKSEPSRPARNRVRVAKG